MFKLNAKFDADLLLYSFSCFECDGHTVHMLTHQCLPPQLTSTVKSSLFTHAHSSPLPLSMPGYIDVTQTVLVILTMARLLLDRPHMHSPWTDNKVVNAGGGGLVEVGQGGSGEYL